MVTLIAQPDSNKESLTVPDEALALFVALDLEGRLLVAMPNGGLRVGFKIETHGAIPHRQVAVGLPLSEEQRTKIARYKTHLLALVAYCAEPL